MASAETFPGCEELFCVHITSPWFSVIFGSPPIALPLELSPFSCSPHIFRIQLQLLYLYSDNSPVLLGISLANPSNRPKSPPINSSCSFLGAVGYFSYFRLTSPVVWSLASVPSSPLLSGPAPASLVTAMITCLLRPGPCSYYLKPVRADPCLLPNTQLDPLLHLLTLLVKSFKHLCSATKSLSVFSLPLRPPILEVKVETEIPLQKMALERISFLTRYKELDHRTKQFE